VAFESSLTEVMPLYHREMRAVVLLLLTGCELLFSVEPSSEPRRRTLEIRHTSTVQLIDFPVRVAFDDDERLRDHAVTDGSDLVFRDAGGEELAAEVHFDGVTGTLDAWVKLPVLHAEPVTIHLDYGGGELRTLDPRLTWTVFHAAWHMSGLEDVETDSTRTIDVVALPGEEPESMAGIAGLARRFDGNAKLCASNSEPELGDSSFGFAVWVHMAELDRGQFDKPIFKGGNNPATAGFTFQLGTEVTEAAISDGQNRAADSHVRTPLTLGFDDWVHVAASVQRIAPTAGGSGEVRTYVNGALSETRTIPMTFGGVSPSPNMCLGGSFHGGLDEVRIYSGVVPGDWFLAEARNLRDRDAFVTVISDE
jgi:hypothetical protein